VTITGPVGVRLVLPDGDEVPVGTLRVNRGRGHETAMFAYEPAYLADPRAYAIDPELPLRAGTAATRPDADLFGAMSDSTPDRWGQNLLRRAERHQAHVAGRAQRELTTSDFLAGVHDDLRQGALRYVDPAGAYLAGDERGVPKVVDLPRLLALTDRALRDPSLDTDLRDLVDAGASLGGARPKAGVRDHVGVLRIAKFPRATDDEWDVEAWEKVALDLASAAGIAVPRNELVKVLGRNVLLVDRFDRDGQRRVGYLSAMALLSLVGRTRDVSLAELAEQMQRDTAAPDEDLRELYRRGLFGLLVSNTDNHARNHGLLRTPAGWRLAPAFDVNPNPEPAAFAMPLDPGGADDIAEAIEAADAFRLTRAQALDELATVLAAVSGWQRRATDLGIPTPEITLMRDAFESPRTAQARQLTRI
jgi:serine/threonine-protein kinase HipA